MLLSVGVTSTSVTHDFGCPTFQLEAWEEGGGLALLALVLTQNFGWQGTPGKCTDEPFEMPAELRHR